MEVGEKKNLLEFIGEKMHKGRRLYGLFRCDCGNTKFIRMDSVNDGSIKSCGCLSRNSVGLSPVEYERLYNVWANMIKRCYDEKSDRYYTYGARGITVCDAWKNDFRCFAKWAVQNGWNKKLSIERKDFDVGYSPQNCTFITMKEQARNKTNCIFIEYDNQRKCIAEWCEILGLDSGTVYARYKRGIKEPSVLLYDGDLRAFRGSREVFRSV